MDLFFSWLAGFTVGCVGQIVWHLLTDDDDCTHPDVGQSGECERCGEIVDIGGSE